MWCWISCVSSPSPNVTVLTFYQSVDEKYKCWKLVENYQSSHCGDNIQGASEILSQMCNHNWLSLIWPLTGKISIQFTQNNTNQLMLSTDHYYQKSKERHFKLCQSLCRRVFQTRLLIIFEGTSPLTLNKELQPLKHQQSMILCIIKFLFSILLLKSTIKAHIKLN